MAEPALTDDALADAVGDIVHEAAQMAMAKWRTDFRRWEKRPGDPVSEVDLAVDALLHERLSALLPEAGWLSEESADDLVRLDRRRVWVVDPIDGTRDYIRGRTGWCVSVALVEDGAVTIGVLDAPARDERWVARADGAATRNGMPLHASPCAAIAGARMPIDTLPRADRDMVAVAKPNSIALRIAMVAAGEADVVATQRWGNEWDVAAAVLIATRAGAFVGDGQGRPLAFNQRMPRAFGVLAAAPALRDAAVARFAPRAAAAMPS